ncbi:MAG: peptide-methionine (R)-S-oxide reductase MsrB [Magnetococcales bacterium]|nr:peptide-methionine (R)-S-oxide reductase MsrB [Magnetococcales bacterium]
MRRVEKNEEEWRRELNPAEYAICRCQGTEAPFTGRYWRTKTPGIYGCRCCGEPLFASTAKYDSGTGWPSFFQPLDQNKIETREDKSHGMQRVEVLCRACGAHLGHLFDDGPEPTGLRYCLNSASLTLAPDHSGDPTFFNIKS